MRMEQPDEPKAALTQLPANPGDLISSNFPST
jgi:hypothetical protein